MPASPSPPAPAHGPLRVWLDDDLIDRAAPDGWVHVQTAWQAIELLDGREVLDLSLDHDLGGDEQHGTGDTVVTWLAEQSVAHGRDRWPRETLTLHTANPHGRDRMALAVDRHAPMARIPGSRPRWRRIAG